MRYLLINTKNYLEASGKNVDRLAACVRKAGENPRLAKIFLAVSPFDLRYLHVKYPGLNLLAQHLDDSRVGSSTGYLVPEIAKIAGAGGSIINHSEHRIPSESIEALVRKLRELRLSSIVCAKNETEVSSYASFSPDFIAIEPPELIGTGRAVSKVSPQIITRSKDALKEAGPPGSKTKLLCGAGIVSGVDAQKAVELGAQGILIASGVVLSRNWNQKISELLAGLMTKNRN
jgi:triosephosphate isomerase (TIM)